MSDSKARRAAEIQNSIRDILYRDWDPIGVNGTAPKDEYDSYIAPVYRILTGSRSEKDLIDFFSDTELQLIGEAFSSPDALRSVARKLLELDVRL